MVRRITPLILGGCLLGLSGSALALGLGTIDLQSHLNEPLKARIRLLSVDNLATGQIHARLAKPEDFERSGVDYAFYLNQIRFRPIVADNGKTYIELTTKSPVKEPFVDVLVEVSWPNGRLLREYTVLLDPPVFSTVAQISAPSIPAVAPAPVVEHSANPPAPGQTTAQWPGGAHGNYRVRHRDTLWSIARRVRPNKRLSIQRTMVALYAANPSAFLRGNMNSLKQGAVLSIPEAKSVEALSQQQALLEIARQNQSWQGKTAGTRPNGMLDTTDYASVRSDNRSSEPRLKLSAPGDADVNGSGTGGGSDEAIATLKVENDTLKIQVSDSAARVQKLERLLALKDSQLAALQNSAAATTAKTGVRTTEEPVNAATTSTVAEQPGVGTEHAGATEPNVAQEDKKTTTAAQTEATKSAVETGHGADITASTVDIGAKSKPATPAVTETTPTATAVPLAPTTGKSSSIFDSILNMGMSMWMALLSLLAVIGFSVVWYRRHKMSGEAYQESLDVSVEGDFNDEALPDVADDILANEFGGNDEYIPESEVQGLEDDASTNEVSDPLGEADVYIAYGKYEQAEKLLRESLEAEADRVDLRLKLMECLAEVKSQGAFKEQKTQIESLIATDPVVAEKVDEMERRAWPDEFEGEDFGEMPSTEDIFGDLAFAGDDAADTGSAQDDELVFDDEPEANAGSGTEADIEAGSELEFEIDADPLPLAAAEEVSINEDEGQESSTTDEDAILEDDFMDMDVDTFEQPGDVDEAMLDLGDVDEASTKLDLARAYIDMEDFDGAREILNEVMSEGSEEQQAEANELLGRL